jgi:hypothetical protein
MSEAKQTVGEEKSKEKKQGKKAVAELLGEKKSAKAPWTVERCKKVAKRFKSASEWEMGAPASYKSAMAHGWVAQCMGGASSKVRKSA